MKKSQLNPPRTGECRHSTFVASHRLFQKRNCKGSIMSKLMVYFVSALLLLLPFVFTVHAQTQPEWLSALRSGGYVIVIRHGATHNDQADTDPFHLRNIGKQRQLTDEGRATAQEIGEAWQKLKIPVGD